MQFIHSFFNNFYKVLILIRTSHSQVQTSTINFQKVSRIFLNFSLKVNIFGESLKDHEYK